MEIILLKFLTVSPIIQVATVMIGVFLSFITAVARKDVSLYVPFISETGAYSPEMCIFSLFLIMGSFIGTTFTIGRYLLLLQHNASIIRFLNFISLIAGMAAMFGMAAVAAFPMTTVIEAHLCVAAIYFVGSGVYFSLTTILTWKLEGRSKVLIIRGLLTMALFGFLLLLVITFPIALKIWREHNDILPALKTPEHKGFALVVIAALTEWATAFTICLFNLTFIVDFKNHGLILGLTTLKNQSSAPEENLASAIEEANDK